MTANEQHKIRVAAGLARIACTNALRRIRKVRDRAARIAARKQRRDGKSVAQ